jgi:site-specific DNA recombinase
MTTALIYARVSTEEQGRGYSLPTQTAAAERRAAERGYILAGSFTDEHTGTEFERPGLTALYEAIQRIGATIVLCHDIDRIGREVIVQAIIEREIENAGARIEYVQGDYQDTPEGDLLKAVKGGIAAYENRQRVERSRRGKNGRARSGSVIVPTGRAPYGYTYVSRPHGGELIVNEEEATWVRQIFAWISSSRLSSYAISRRLYEAGVPSKGDLSTAVAKKAGRADWSPTSIRKMLKNEVYKGTWYWGKTRTAIRVDPKTRQRRKRQIAQPPEDWISVPVPAIVDAGTWELAQSCLARNKQQARRNSKRDYLLQGRIFCTCGRRWVGRYKNHLDRAYYRCPTSEHEPWRKACESRFSYRQEVVEGAVWSYVIGQLLHPDRLGAEIARQQQSAQLDAQSRATRLGTLHSQLRDVDRKLEILVGQALDGVPQSVLDVHKRALLAQRDILEDQRTRNEAGAERIGISGSTLESLQELAAIVQAAEPNLTAEERKRMLEVLRLRVDVIDHTRAVVSGLVSDTVVDLSSSSVL